MPWKFRKRGRLFVELFVNGQIGVSVEDKPHMLLDAEEARWLAEVALPELLREREGQLTLDFRSERTAEPRAATHRKPTPPQRPPGAIPLILSKPPRRVNEMREAEIDAWADQLFFGLKAQLERSTDRRISTPTAET